MAWQQAIITWRDAALGSWLVRTTKRFASADGRKEEEFEGACSELLSLTLAGAPAGVALSQPWEEFAGEMRPPDHPAQRVPSNLQRFAGNYMNLLLVTAAFASASVRPFFVTFCLIAKAIALLAPPEMFDVDVLQGKAAGGGYRAVGGPWLRCGLVALGHAGLGATSVFTSAGCRGLVVGTALVLSHALFRTRPWTEVAKERLTTRLKSQ
ncbi:unnamed protein product [Symbiodinium necroappetens]|uniref:PRA1 family protein n=2 Tax=Symbiodinium TaxID=2949 RepID=A0A812UZ34_9DINO|nr:hypothetical protein AK812_SmicGene5136 [Symbiodinium microadriaticum]CAE7588518.1 unnamed protein product [Symbiodinium microadriaticum]CAE7604563.1 unnamed protein product [Symbiodinium necroappetens]